MWQQKLLRAGKSKILPEMLENRINFGRRMLGCQHLCWSGFKVVMSKTLSLFHFSPMLLLEAAIVVKPATHTPD